MSALFPLKMCPFPLNKADSADVLECMLCGEI